MFWRLRRARLCFTADNQAPDRHYIAGKRYKQRENPKSGESDGEKHIAGDFSVPCADEAPGPGPLLLVFPDPRDGQQGKEQHKTPNDSQSLLCHTCLHVIGVPVRVSYRHSPFDRHGTGQEEGAQAKGCHAHPEETAQIARWVDVLPLHTSSVDWYHYWTRQKLSKQVS